MYAIFLKELSHFFKGTSGYIYLAITLLVSAIFFTIFNLFSMSANYADFLNRSQVVFFLTAPLLTMRLFAEERKNKTDQLLLSSPITTLSMVLGKVLAALVVFFITIFFFCLYLVVLGLLGYPDWPRAIGALVGYILLGTSLIALGSFISSCTENQLSAAVISFAAIFLFWLLPAFGQLLPSSIQGGALFFILLSLSIAFWLYQQSKNFIAALLFMSIISLLFITIIIFKPLWFHDLIIKSFTWISLSSRYENFHSGLLKWHDVLYYISFSLFFIYATAWKIEQQRFNGG